MASPKAPNSLHLISANDPAQSNTFLAALNPIYEKVISAPECNALEVFRSSEEPGVFGLVEFFDGDWK